jgi:hypothetical protein
MTKIEYMYNFVYKTINTINGKYYIGKHSTNNLNDGYLGSGNAINDAINKYGIENFKREIISFWSTSEDALREESNIVNVEFINSHDNYNLKTGGNGGLLSETSKDKLKAFNTGKTCVYDEYGNIIKLSTNDDRYQSGEYQSIYKNTILVKDNNGKCFRVSTNDPRYVSGQLVSPRTGSKNTPDARKKVSDKLKGRIFSDETKELWSTQRKGKSASNKNKVCITNLDTNTIKYIDMCELDEWISNGWIKGRKVGKI